MSDCLEILKRHQKWRIGSDDVEPCTPRQLSVAIYEVISEVEMRRRGECICVKCGLRQNAAAEEGHF